MVVRRAVIVLVHHTIGAGEVDRLVAGLTLRAGRRREVHRDGDIIAHGDGANVVPGQIARRCGAVRRRRGVGKGQVGSGERVRYRHGHQVGIAGVGDHDVKRHCLAHKRGVGRGERLHDRHTRVADFDRRLALVVGRAVAVLIHHVIGGGMVDGLVAGLALRAGRRREVYGDVDGVAHGDGADVAPG